MIEHLNNQAFSNNDYVSFVKGNKSTSKYSIFYFRKPKQLKT